MTLVELVKLIGNILTEIDSMLSRPELSTSDPDWQQLYALRKHLDDQQRELVKLSINLSDAAYTTATQQIAAANAEITKVLGDFAKIDKVINNIAKVAGYIDKVLQIAGKVGI